MPQSKVVPAARVMLRRKAAADYIFEKTGVPMSDRTLEKRPIPFCIINGKAVYTQADLDAYISQLMNGASRRMFVGRIARTAPDTRDTPKQ